MHTYLMNMGLIALATAGLALAWNFNLLPSRCENCQQVAFITFRKKGIIFFGTICFKKNYQLAYTYER